MDSESRAAAELLQALCRAAAAFGELRHPYVRREVLSRVDPVRVLAGTAFFLPDGREVRFTVSMAATEGAFRVEGEVAVEERVLLDLPAVSSADLAEALAAFDGYVYEVVSRASWTIDELIDELTA